MEQLLRYIESFSTYNDKVFRVIMDALGYDEEGYYIKDSKYWSTSAFCYGDIIHMLTCLDVIRVKIGKLFYYMTWDSELDKYRIV